MSATAERIEQKLRERFRPDPFELHDESERHRGHAGATSGGGHYRVVLVSEEFRDRSLLERHRMVNEALAGMFGAEIHALALTTLTPEEWRQRAD